MIAVSQTPHLLAYMCFIWKVSDVRCLKALSAILTLVFHGLMIYRLEFGKVAYFISLALYFQFPLEG